MTRRATRYNHRDANEPELIPAARKLGLWCVEGGPLDWWVSCQNLHSSACGFNQWVPVEVKNPGGKRKPGQKGEFRDSQIEFMAECDRRGMPYAVWRTLEDVVIFTRGR